MCRGSRPACTQAGPQLRGGLISPGSSQGTAGKRYTCDVRRWVVLGHLKRRLEAGALHRMQGVALLPLDRCGGAAEGSRQLEKRNLSSLSWHARAGMSMQPVTVPTSLLIFKDLAFRGFWLSGRQVVVGRANACRGLMPHCVGWPSFIQHVFVRGLLQNNGVDARGRPVCIPQVRAAAGP